MISINSIEKVNVKMPYLVRLWLIADRDWVRSRDVELGWQLTVP